jgi:hypothetical protein
MATKSLIIELFEQIQLLSQRIAEVERDIARLREAIKRAQSQRKRTMIPSVLIACHTTKVTYENGKIVGHWQTDPIVEMISTYLGADNANVYTADIQNADNDIVGNLWSPEIINEHKDQFDMILLPDCAGPWFTALESNNPPRNLVAAMRKLEPMLKAGGYIAAGKLIGNEERVQQLLPNSKVLTLKWLGTELKWVIYRP